MFQDTETLERKTNLFPGVGGQVEDQHREEGDAHAGDDQIHLQTIQLADFDQLEDPQPLAAYSFSARWVEQGQGPSARIKSLVYMFVIQACN